MRLSEAIRLGSMLRPQAFGTMFDGVGTCAIGAANEAIGETGTGVWRTNGLTDDLCEEDGPPEWRWVDDVDACPACPEYSDDSLLNIVAHLNDIHRWSREAIADYIETLERERNLPSESATPADAVATPTETPVAATRA